MTEKLNLQGIEISNHGLQMSHFLEGSWIPLEWPANRWSWRATPIVSRFRCPNFGQLAVVRPTKSTWKSPIFSIHRWWNPYDPMFLCLNYLGCTKNATFRSFHPRFFSELPVCCVDALSSTPYCSHAYGPKVDEHRALPLQLLGFFRWQDRLPISHDGLKTKGAEILNVCPKNIQYVPNIWPCWVAWLKC